MAANGIGNTHVANGALSPLKIAGTAATLGPNTFVGPQSIAGNLDITGNQGVSGNFFANTVTTNLADIRGNATVRGNGLDIQIGNVGCGPPTAGIGTGGVTCATFALGFDGSLRSTFINRPTGGRIAFREGNGPDQMTIAPGGSVSIGIGVNGAGGGLKHGRFGPFFLPDRVLAAAYRITWPTPFADANYTASVMLEINLPGVTPLAGPKVDRIFEVSADGLTLAVSNNVSRDWTFFVHIVAVHH